MKRSLSIVTFGLLLILGSVLFVSAINLSHLHHDHGGAHSSVPCPFTAHEDTICPMTALDHLSILRGILDATIHGLVSLVLVFGLAILWSSYPDNKSRLRWAYQLYLKWRKRVTYSFNYRQWQVWFARGILNPKLF